MRETQKALSAGQQGAVETVAKQCSLSKGHQMPRELGWGGTPPRMEKEACLQADFDHKLAVCYPDKLFSSLMISLFPIQKVTSILNTVH